MNQQSRPRTPHRLKATALGTALALGLGINAIIHNPANNSVSISLAKIKRHRLKIPRQHRLPATPEAPVTAMSKNAHHILPQSITPPARGVKAAIPATTGNKVFELKELYDRNLLKVIARKNPQHDIDGLLEIENGKITDVFAHIDGLQLIPVLSKGQVEGDYNYQAEDKAGESIMGKAQATFINTNELNLYFVSGLYRGYTLIFSLKLSDGQAFEKEILHDELRHQELSQSNSETTVEDAMEAQANALDQRQRIAEMTNALIEESNY